MRILLIALLTLNLSLFTKVAQAQTNLDSLWGIWNDKTQADTTRLKAMQKIAWDGYIFSQPDSAFYFAQMQYDLAEKSGLKEQMAGALNTQGASFWMSGDYPKALDYYQRCLKIHEEMGDKNAIAGTLNNMGAIYRDQGDYPKALDYYQRSLKIMEEFGDKKRIPTVLGNIGIIYNKQGDYPKALDYFLRSLKIMEEFGDKKGTAMSLNNIGNLYADQGDYPKALDYFLRSLKIYEEMGDKNRIAGGLGNIGIIYKKQGDYPKALDYYQRSLKFAEEMGNKNAIAQSLGNIGSLYSDQGDNLKALDYCQRSLKIYEEIGNKNGIAISLISIGGLYGNQSDYQQAINQCSKGLLLAQEIGAIDNQSRACECMYNAYKSTGNTNQALAYHEQYIMLKDSLFNEENTKKLTQLEMQYDFDKKEAAAHLEQEKKDALAAADLRRNKLIKNGFIAAFTVMLLFALVFLAQRNKIKKGKKQSDDLLLNILPAEVAEELKNTGESEAKHFDEVSILFTDFKGFTQASELLSAKDLVNEINTCFKAFDNICDKYGIEKIKTIGDSYMCAVGLGRGSKDKVQSSKNAFNMVSAAIEMQTFMQKRSFELETLNLKTFSMRCGIHTGPVVAGIVGIKKFQYDIWGDTVNTASRMESHGEVGKVNISEATYNLLTDTERSRSGSGASASLSGHEQFSFEAREVINVKGKGDLKMYFVRK